MKFGKIVSAAVLSAFVVGIAAYQIAAAFEKVLLALKAPDLNTEDSRKKISENLRANEK